MSESAPNEAVTRLRGHARDIFARGVAEADPGTAVVSALLGTSDESASLRDEIASASTVRVVAFGKAACRMARGSISGLETLGAGWQGLAVVNRENFDPVEGFRVLASGHPFPDQDGVRAAAALKCFVETSPRDALILVLISGGGSAILPAPAAGIELDDKLDATTLLLSCAATIQEINTVRKHLSSLKGGGLARSCATFAEGDLSADLSAVLSAERSSNRSVRSLILSDVIGDDLSTIASGPTVGDPTTFLEARSILEERGIWSRVPTAVRERLERGERGEIEETPKPGDPIFSRVKNTLVGSNGQSLAAAVARAEELGYTVHVLSDRLVGEARDAGSFFADRLVEIHRTGDGAGDGSGEPIAILAGGETTVHVVGDGKGGRNQEMALAFALRVAEESGGADRASPMRPWAFLSAGTDGIDGPTDAAGAIIDAQSIARGRAGGLSAEDALRRNDAYPFLRASGDLWITGATGTNVADLQVLLVGARP